MSNCSLTSLAPWPRRKVIAGGLAAVGLILGCGRESPAGPPAGKPTRSPFGPGPVKIIVKPRRFKFYGMVTVVADQTTTPLAALQKSGVEFESILTPAGPFISSLLGQPGFPLFLVDDRFPDRAGWSRVRRIGVMPIRSASDLTALGEIKRGTIGVDVIEEVEPRFTNGGPTAETLYLIPPGQPSITFRWLVGDVLLPDGAERIVWL